MPRADKRTAHRIMQRGVFQWGCGADEQTLGPGSETVTVLENRCTVTGSGQKEFGKRRVDGQMPAHITLDTGTAIAFSFPDRTVI